MKLAKKRRLEFKTDYKKRIALLKSGSPRLVFRKTNKYISAQFVTSKDAQDKAEFGIVSRELIKYGWPENFSGSLKSIPASYLLGYLVGKKILEKKLETPVVDFGMYRMIHKGRQFSFLKGLIDSGLNIKCDEEHFPEEERISGKNLKEDFSENFKKIKSNINKNDK